MTANGLQVARRERIEVGVDRQARGDGAGHPLTMTRRIRSSDTVAPDVGRPALHRRGRQTLRDSIRRFVANELRPHAAQVEQARWFPDEVFAKLVGFLGWRSSSTAEGGYVPTTPSSPRSWRAAARAGSAAGIGAHAPIATPPLWKFGTEDEKRRYLVPAIAGTTVAALAITEPGTGSNAAAITTRAARVEGGFVVNGKYLHHQRRARGLLRHRGQDDGRGGHHGLSFLIVDAVRGLRGQLDKLGWHASDTATVALPADLLCV